ncbi:MAG TPA: glycoside hydrolase family 44 protein, partial [Polyangiaceae bacterium]|nr:glycoside hydrolase family 44 protein [Polyangiaceae bacterium]
RIGGNPLTRLNWDLGNVWNVGSDWFFENGSGGEGLFSWLDDAVEHGAKSALVVPTIGWVAKDTTSVGFPRSKLPAQHAYDQWRPEAGDGRAPDGKPLASLPATQTSVPATPETIGRWIRMLRTRDERRSQESVLMYILDNEPSLWNQTHRDVHPEPVSYDELLDRTLRYGGAIRAAAPDAVIAGPAEWGWKNYFTSAKDTVAGGDAQPDRRAHGGVPLIPWYLSKLAEQEQRTGTRILDALDVHFYPAADGVYGPPGKTDAETAAKRLRATRALWDPSYYDESWIREPIRLIPRLQEWVASSYPGRQVVLGEWSFGAEGHISGGLAIAEALGRFGQLGLDAAFNWGEIKPGSPAAAAYLAYRNYDGKGARFLDWSVPTRMDENVSLFASRSEDSKKLVLVLVNLEPRAAVNAHVDLRACGSLGDKRSFVYTAESTGLTAQTLRAPNNGEIVALAPPYSITVVEVSTTPAAQP